MENKINWIECNLPWNLREDRTNEPKQKDFYDFDEEAEKRFPGFKDLKNKCREFGFSRWKYDIQDKYNLSYEEFENSEYSKHENYLLLKKLSDLEYQARTYFYENPVQKMIEFNKALKKFDEDWLKNNPSFLNQKLNKPGTLIKLKNGKVYLIGDMNTFGGVCNDCMDIKSDDVIVAYANILDTTDFAIKNRQINSESNED